MGPSLTGLDSTGLTRRCRKVISVGLRPVADHPASQSVTTRQLVQLGSTWPRRICGASIFISGEVIPPISPSEGVRANLSEHGQLGSGLPK